MLPMDEAGLRADWRAWVGLAVLALPTLLLSLDVSVFYLALPRLSVSLGASGTEQLWILDIYSFTLSGFLITMGTLGDRIGRRRLLLWGAACFGLASVAAAYSTSPAMLIGARAVLGVAGATLAPSTLALIRNMFPRPGQMSVAVGVWFGCFVGGVAIGPVVGGVLLEDLWWGSVFLLGVPVMALLMALGPSLLPEYRDGNAGGLDLASVGLWLAAVLPAVYGLKEAARRGWQLGPLTALCIGIAVTVVFTRRQRRLVNPLLDLRLFRDRTFSTALSVMLLGGVVMTGVTLVTTLYLQTVTGLSPLRAGLWSVPQYVAMALGSVAAPVLARRVRTAYVIAMGLVIAGTGLIVLSQVDDSGRLGPLVTGLVLASGGISLPMAVVTNVVLASASPERAGAAASLAETSGEFGVALGVATLGSLATAVYRGRFGHAGPADAVHHAREGITAAVATARRVPGAAGAELLHTARAAFTAALDIVAVVGAVVFLCLAVAAVLLLRRADRPITDFRPAPEPAADLPDETETATPVR